jgi:hypothetical protein
MHREMSTVQETVHRVDRSAPYGVSRTEEKYGERGQYLEKWNVKEAVQEKNLGSSRCPASLQV